MIFLRFFLPVTLRFTRAMTNLLNPASGFGHRGKKEWFHPLFLSPAACCLSPVLSNENRGEEAPLSCYLHSDTPDDAANSL
jgi:hypothetical protein